MTADEFVNRMSGYSYVSTRSRHYRDTLQAARLGHLAPNWRDNLRPISAQVGGPEYHVDAEALRWPRYRTCQSCRGSHTKPIGGWHLTAGTPQLGKLP